MYIKKLKILTDWLWFTKNIGNEIEGILTF
jgi:hypothetical protein